MPHIYTLNCPFPCTISTHSNTPIPRPTPPTTPNGIQIQSAVLPQFTYRTDKRFDRPTDRQTDRQTDGRTDGETDRQTDKKTDRWDSRQVCKNIRLHSIISIKCDAANNDKIIESD